MTGVRLIASSYSDGLPGVGMGAGPERLLALGAADAAAAEGVDRIDPVPASDPELVRVAELDRRLARVVRATVDAGAFPLVLAGNCHSCLGTVSGAGAEGIGVVWFDAHADFDAPDDSLGFFDAMGLRILTGTGYRNLRDSIPGFRAVDESAVVLAGVRDVEDYQEAPLAASGLRVVPGDPYAAAALEPALDALRERCALVYLHLDLDALDPAEGRANVFAAPGGLTLDELLAGVAATFARFEVAAAAVTAYDPALDPDDRMGRAGLAVIRAVAEGIRTTAR